MPEPLQTTIYGDTEPLRTPDAPVEVSAPVRLFDAPTTMRGQLAIATDERIEDQTAK